MKPGSFRFSSREMLLLILALGLGLGWWADHRHLQNELRRIPPLAPFVYKHAGIESELFKIAIPTFSGPELIGALSVTGDAHDPIDLLVFWERNEIILHELWRRRDELKPLLEQNTHNKTRISTHRRERTTIGFEISKLLDKDFDPNKMQD